MKKEKKLLEEKIQQEEQLQIQFLNSSKNNKHEENTHAKEIQNLLIENQQLREGCQHLRQEMKRLQVDRSDLQEKIKTSFSVIDKENKELEKILEGLQNELLEVKKEKKALIDSITTVTLGKVKQEPLRQSVNLTISNSSSSNNLSSSAPVSGTTSGIM